MVCVWGGYKIYANNIYVYDIHMYVYTISRTLFYEKGKKGRKLHLCQTLFGNFSGWQIDTLKDSIHLYYSVDTHLVFEFFLLGHRKNKTYMELPFCNQQDRQLPRFLPLSRRRFHIPVPWHFPTTALTGRWMTPPLTSCHQRLMSY